MKTKILLDKYKSRRSAVGGRQSAVGGQRSAVGSYTRTNQILYHLIKLLLVITPSIFIRLIRKYYHSNPLIETILMSIKSQRLNHPFSKYLESSPIIIYICT